VAELSVRADRARQRARGWAEGANERERGGGRARRGAQKGRCGSDVAGERAVMGARPRRGNRGREVRDGLIGGDGRTERGRAGARERTSADKSGPRDRERGGSGCALGLAPIGGTRLSDVGGVRARAGGLG
jgi:hypothetical protein